MVSDRGHRQTRLVDGLMRLAGKVAVVTGCAVGLGRAVAARFAREGAAVVAADTNVEGGRAVVEHIEKEGGCALFVGFDVAQESDVIALLKAASEKFKRIDVLYNNA